MQRERGGANDAERAYPPIGDYGYLSDGRTAALVSRRASVDWWCIPRIDGASVFGRLLDWNKGGYCELNPSEPTYTSSRQYLRSSLVLATTFEVGGAVARVVDCLTRGDEESRGGPRLLRVVEGVRGSIEFGIHIAPRFDYGGIPPWVARRAEYVWTAIGGNDGLFINSDVRLSSEGEHDLVATFDVKEGARVRFAMQWMPPEELTPTPPAAPPAELDRRLEATLAWWRERSEGRTRRALENAAADRSAIVLIGLTNAATGAVAAAATTSLPEDIGSSRNWDYRYSWIRDSQFTVRSLAELGFDAEADAFRRFVERSAAGSAESLRVLYGVHGERRIPELELTELDGYRGSRPVRVGNAAAGQCQLDVYGYLLDLAWRWHQRGQSPDDDYWRFLLSVVNKAAATWEEPDRGIWEVRGEPQHFVHSKAMCWVALDRGIRLSDECLRRAPVDDWAQTRDAIRQAIDKKGYDDERGVFVRSFGSSDVDAALLLLPAFDFVAYDDERMVRTTEAVAHDLDDRGLLRRYACDDGLEGRDAPFVACTFWLAECYAHLGRIRDANMRFHRAAAAANDLGLFSEEYDTGHAQMLGNFPLALTHLSHIAARVAIAHVDRSARDD